MKTLFADTDLALPRHRCEVVIMDGQRLQVGTTVDYESRPGEVEPHLVICVGLNEGHGYAAFRRLSDGALAYVADSLHTTVLGKS